MVWIRIVFDELIAKDKVKFFFKIIFQSIAFYYFKLARIFFLDIVARSWIQINKSYQKTMPGESSRIMSGTAPAIQQRLAYSSCRNLHISNNYPDIFIYNSFSLFFLVRLRFIEEAAGIIACQLLRSWQRLRSNERTGFTLQKSIFIATLDKSDQELGTNRAGRHCNFRIRDF